MNKNLFKHLCVIFLSFIVVLSLTSCKRKNNNGNNNPPIIVESIEASCEKDTMFIGEKISFDYQLIPSDSSEVSLTVSDDTIIKVENNEVIGLKAGDASVTITATSKPEVSKTLNFSVLPNLEEEKNEVKYISTGAGQNASTSATVSYHAYNKNTSIEYTISSDTSFSSAKVMRGYCYYFHEVNENYETPFEERYIYRVTLPNLTPSTEYIYRINKGDNTYTDTYCFKTASGSGGMSFLMLADIHYWAKDDGTSHGSEVSEKTIAKALEINPNINLVLDVGDTVDTGGDQDCWNVLYENRQSLKNLLWAGVPGNHEYYINGTGQLDNRFHKAFVPTNLNGPLHKVGSTYYFEYNDVLFLMIDNAKKIGYNYQIEWIENLLKTTSAKYVVAGMHIPINEGANSANATDSDPKLMALFEKYGVDLVLSGHYHGENYKTHFQNGSGTDDAGVVYLRGAFAGIKSANTNDVEGSISGYIVDITDDGTFTITVINGRGEVKRTYTFNTKKYTSSTPTDLQTITDSVKCEHHPETNQVTFSWTPLAYGNIKSISIKELLREEYSTEVLLISKGYTSATLACDVIGYDSLYQVDIICNDDKVITLHYSIKTQDVAKVEITNVTSNSADLTFTKADDYFKFRIDHYDVYLNGTFYKSISYKNDTDVLSDLMANTKYKVEFKAIGYYDEIIFINEYEFETK